MKTKHDALCPKCGKRAYLTFGEVEPTIAVGIQVRFRKHGETLVSALEQRHWFFCVGCWDAAMPLYEELLKQLPAPPVFEEKEPS